MATEFTEEQKRALALAAARKRLKEKASAEEKPRSAIQEIGRQLGLTARYGIEGGLGLVDTLTGPIRLLQNKLLPESLQAAPAGPFLADKLGLPQPETGTERIVGSMSRALAGAGGTAGVAGKAGSALVPGAQNIASWLAANTGLQAQAALGSGLAQGGAAEAGAGPYGQLAAALAGGIAAPTAIRATRVAAEPLMDIGATIGAAGGSQRGTQRLVADAANRIAGEAKGKVVPALVNAKEYVPGAPPTAAEAIAQAQIGSPQRFGGSVVRLQRDLTGARGVEDVLPSVNASQKAAIERASSSINQRTSAARTAALEAANKGGVRSAGVLQRIDDILAQPGQRASTVVSRSLREIRNKIERFTGDDGIIDSKDLYTIRKEIGSVIEKHAKKNANWDKALSSGLQRDVQVSIDDAIEAAGGAGWREYLKTYSTEMRGIEKHAERLAEAKAIGSQVKSPVGANIAPGEIPQPPTLLSRPMMLVNYGLKFFAHDANDPVVKELTRLLQNPKEFAKVLYERPTQDPLRQRMIEVMNRGAMAAAQSGEK